MVPFLFTFYYKPITFFTVHFSVLEGSIQLSKKPAFFYNGSLFMMAKNED